MNWKLLALSVAIGALGCGVLGSPTVWRYLIGVVLVVLSYEVAVKSGFMDHMF